MTLQQLEYIIALDTYQHFVTAAEKCYVTQPTLSMQVNKLEEEIGVRIFDRSRKPLRPTKVGEQIILKARQILREVDQLKDIVSGEVESIDGEFTIGIIPTVAPFLLPLFLPQFIKEQPNTFLKIKELQTEEIITALHQGTIDIGILATPLEEKDIREITLFHEPFLLYLPKEHILSKNKNAHTSDLKLNELLVLEEGHCFREQTLNLCSHLQEGRQKGFEYESGSIETLKGLVEQGMGYTLVPELSITDKVGLEYIKRFVEPQPVREISLVVHNSFSKEALIERLHNKITASLPKSIQKTRSFMKVRWR
ncbi:MAG: LysR family transcriptional regulator [Cytophagales bacterium]|nr:LysR family transcriptional regulator [Cytophagales bacterium]